jgi:hypothetical protein
MPLRERHNTLVASASRAFSLEEPRQYGSHTSATLPCCVFGGQQGAYKSEKTGGCLTVTPQ